MRALAISALIALSAFAAVPLASAAAPNPVFVHVEPVVCVTDPCPPMVWCDPADTGGAVRYERFHDCSERISVDGIDCLFGEHWEYVVNTPLLVVRYSACNTPE
jgi:hypothetical protein